MKTVNRSTTFTMTLPEYVVEALKREARERSVKEEMDYTYQDILREICAKKYKHEEAR